MPSASPDGARKPKPKSKGGRAEKTPQPDKKQKRKTGARGKYNDQTLTVIFDAIRQGETNKGAAMLAGITEGTFYEWLQTKPEFSEQIIRVRAERRKTLISRIETASSEHWQAAKFLLQVYHPEEFARQRIEVTGANGGPIETATALDRELAAAVRANPASLEALQKTLAAALVSAKADA